MSNNFAYELNFDLYWVFIFEMYVLSMSVQLIIDNSLIVVLFEIVKGEHC
jgi:hypothetical protein